MNRGATFKNILKHRQHKNHRRKPQDTETLVEKYFTEKFYRLALRKSRCKKTGDFLSVFFKLAQYFCYIQIYIYIYIKTGEQSEGGWDDLQRLSSLELKLFYGKEAMTLQDELRVVNPCGENIFPGTWIIYSSMVQWSLLAKFCCTQRFYKFRSFNHFIY